MKSRIVLCIALMIAGVGAPHADAAAPVRTQQLRNGLTLVLVPDSRAAGVDVTVWYEAGARWESEGKTGITHVLEQLMFRSSGAVPSGEHLRRLHKEGGTVGTHSTHDYSSFYQTVPPEALELVFELEADRMESLGATEDDLAEVRRLVELGRRQSGTTPVAHGLLELFATAFEGHPYAWPAIGLEEDLASISLEDCRAYHAAHYSPDKAVVTVVGRFDPDEALAAARRTLEETPRRRSPRTTSPRFPAQTGERRASRTYEYPGPALFVGWRVPGGESPDVASLDVATRLLAARPTSRLNEALIGRNPAAAFVQGGLEVRKEAGLVYAVIVLNPGADSTAMADVEASVLEEVARFVEEPIRDDDLAAAQREIEITTWFGRQRARDHAMAIGTARLIDGDTRATNKRIEALRRLKPDTVSKAARRHLTEANRTVLWMQPDASVGQGVGR